MKMKQTWQKRSEVEFVQIKLVVLIRCVYVYICKQLNMSLEFMREDSAGEANVKVIAYRRIR